MLYRSLVSSAILLQAATWCLAADPNDWVRVDYVVKAGSSASGETSASRQTIVKKADSTLKDGPWSVTNTKVKPPSGDVHDYLSWAPYHWPNCNWCSRGSNHFVNPNGTDPDDGSSDNGNGNTGDDDDDYYDESIDTPGYVEDIVDDILRFDDRSFPNSKRAVPEVQEKPCCRRMLRKRRSLLRRDIADSPALARRDDDYRAQDVAPVAPPPLPITEPAIPTPPPFTGVVPSVPTAPPIPLSTTASRKGVAATQAPAEAHAKTSQAGKAACTPSPTKSLAPSATWTTCPYVVKDGKVNPDVKMLEGPSMLQNMPESVLFNAINYALTKTAVHSQNAAKTLDTFFLTAATLMHPNMNFGQLVRGPGKDHQIGTFTGILDFRALVKIVNACQILKAVKSPDWTNAKDQALAGWMNKYLTWLQTSGIGKETAGKANNHLTFYVSQVAAAQMFVGDTKGATTTLTNYFKKQFLDQIASSGEQPFEGVRTRPYHYRAFNLEAMITNAKMGDQLGINFWTATSKYGATIQTALDYAIAQNPGSEDVADVVPHVAAIAAAYGDPKGKYKSFLQSKDSGYKGETWYFYDQTAALPNSPAAGKTKRAYSDSESEDELLDWPDVTQLDSSTDATTPFSHIPFQCPDVFNNSTRTELEVGLWVDCADLKPLYEIAADPVIIGDEYGL